MAYRFPIKFLTIIMLSCYVSSTIMTLQFKKEICLFKKLKTNDHIKVSFGVSGDNEYGVNCRLLGPHGQTLYEEINNNSGFYKHQPEKMDDFTEGIFNLCFRQEQGRNLVTFEFSSEEEGGHVINVAHEGTITDLNKNLTSMSYIFEAIEDNIKEFQTRKTVHNNSKIILIKLYQI